MRQLKNVLYITTPETYLSCEGESIVVQAPNKNHVHIPSHNLESVVQFGYPGMSPATMALCAQQGICVSFLYPSGRFLARVEGPQKGSILLRRKQYEIYRNDEICSRLASRFVTAKILNCRTVLMRGIRDCACDIESMHDTCVHLKSLASKAFSQTSLSVLRGIEGEAAQLYFNQINNLLTDGVEQLRMHGRSRRPPMDRFNCLLSFCYTLLTHECRSACETVGLDPQAGYLHTDRPGRPGLALDLMEELRPIFSDRMCISLVNRRQVKVDDFDVKPNGAVLLKEETRSILIDNWQKRKQEQIAHPFLEEKIPFGLLPYAQAMLLARFIRGDIDDYPGFIWR